MSAPIRVAIVDDDALVRAGLGLILGGAPEITVVGEAEDGAAGVSLLRRTPADVVLMDIRMPRMDGIEATAALAREPHPPRVIVLTTFDADDHVVRALAGGASGFLLKDTAPAEIVDAIRKVAAGEPMLSPSVTAQLIRTVVGGADGGRSATARARLADLTDRELEVAVAVGRGQSNADIAAELYMSVATVKAYVSRLFAKLGVDNRVQIAICVHDAGVDE